MSNTITTTYHGVEIEYREYENRWYFALNGKEKNAGSLKEAKEKIDTAPKPKKPFEKFQAYRLDRHDKGSPEVVTVGAQTTDYSGKPAFWTTDGNKRRCTTGRQELIKITPANDEKLAKIRALEAEVSERENAIGALYRELERIDLREE